MRVHSGARVVHEYEWCTRKSLVDWAWNLQEKQLLLSEARTRAAGGGEVKSGEEELACRTSYTVHLDSMFLGVHLDSTSCVVK